MYNSPKILLKGINTAFNQQLAEAPEFIFKSFVNEINSKTNKEQYIIPEVMPYIKEWTDEIGFKKFKEYKWEVENKKFYGGATAVDRDTIKDGLANLGVNTEANIKDCVKDWIDFPSDLINDLISNNGTAFDNSSFFATSHNIDGSNAIDNLKTGSGVTLANLITDLETAMVAMRGYRDKNSRIINKNPKYIVLIPSHLEYKFKKIRTSELIIPTGATSGEDNIFVNSFEIVINDYDLSTNDWYLINTNASRKPFLLQRRESPEWEMNDNPKVTWVEYWSSSRINVGYLNFTAMLKVNN